MIDRSSQFIFRAKKSLKKYGSTLGRICSFFHHQSGHLDYHYSHRRHNCFFINRHDRTKVPREERKKHARELNDKVYTKLSEIKVMCSANESLILKVPEDPSRSRIYDMRGGGEIVRDSMVPPRYLEIDRLIDLELALAHLKKYPDIYRTWKDINALLEDYNKLLVRPDESAAREIIGLSTQFQKKLVTFTRDIDAGAILKGKCRIGY
jgi:hypothetical protein